MTEELDIPLFPLRTVLFPEGPLPLRVFEARYLDMVSTCMKEQRPFGVVLIRGGSETGVASFETLGTLARIVDWYQGSDGILGVTAIGEKRFKVITSDKRSDGLNTARVALLDESPSVPLPLDFRYLAEIIEGVIDDLGKLYENQPRRYDDANWVACRLAEILPIAPEDKQRCLAADEPLKRLAIVSALVQVSTSPDSD